jgi:SAM-dependent methyltransferase
VFYKNLFILEKIMSDKFIFEFFESMPRQGPGSREFTLRALESVKSKLPANPVVLDIGCGNGTQTYDIMSSIPYANLTAIDVHQPFLDMAEQKIGSIKNLSGSFSTLLMSMDKLDFSMESIDLIWSEGAIYIIGFRNGLSKWQRYIKPGGFMVVSEAVWIKPDIPKKIKDFWESEYPEIGIIEEKIKTIQEIGLEPVTHFTLPGSIWLNEFYLPMQKMIDDFRNKSEKKEMHDFLDGMQHEVDMFREYGEYYSYEYFVIRKIG